MSWRLVPLAQVPPTPWANGGGVTRELLAWPDADWTVRLSVAEIAKDGPFSRLAGVRRWFAVLSGQGVRLRTSGAIHELGTSSMPFQFEGAAPTDCQLLGGPTRDFNLMLRQGQARMERADGLLSRRCQATALVAVYANGRAATIGWGSERLAVPPDTLAWCILDRDELVQLAGDDALWMEIAP
ncbi:MAG TPA: HutD family protein [Ramlibacter sp.]|nr:HutD family protein [Ramlibacter sp.]